MDNRKIGKLIADLRRKQGLTQQELGDKVGVGFRAVSKWERGLTLPDISIINELSKILGISSDELLTGKVNKENKTKKKISPKLKITITIMTSIIIILSTILFYYNNKTYEYDLASANKNDCFIKGKMYFNKNKITLIINKIDFKEETFESLKIKNYEYDIRTNGEFLFRYGYINDISELDKIMTIKEFENELNINSTIQTKLKTKELINNNIVLTLRFITEEEEEITKNIEFYLTTKSEENN